MRKRIVQSVIEECPEGIGIRRTLTFRLGEEGTPIPAIFQLPPGEARFPVALLLHGWSSRKEEMAGAIGKALMTHGVASLAFDLPLHGERSDVTVLRGSVDPLRLVREWRAALTDAELALRYLSVHPRVDPSRIALVGYSLGSYLSLALAADEPIVQAVVLAAGGDLPRDTPFTHLIRPFADPMAMVRKLDGRPLLMVHGRHDRTIKPEQAERLFAAAEEPKEMQWWDAGHYLPESAIGGAAEWLKRNL